jgi:hypothetical protein
MSYTEAFFPGIALFADTPFNRQLAAQNPGGIPAAALPAEGAGNFPITASFLVRIPVVANPADPENPNQRALAWAAGISPAGSTELLPAYAALEQTSERLAKDSPLPSPLPLPATFARITPAPPRGYSSTDSFPSHIWYEVNPFGAGPAHLSKNTAYRFVISELLPFQVITVV